MIAMETMLVGSYEFNNQQSQRDTWLCYVKTLGFINGKCACVLFHLLILNPFSLPLANRSLTNPQKQTQLVTVIVLFFLFYTFFSKFTINAQMVIETSGLAIHI